ncbi:MAG: hypothetical protein ACUVRL_03170 [Candidatus Saccharicenans sp.]|uniref:hypothetical protein n=1 Tax=Candidatus Saccharicenans sp. TaxID=2819258 RepID=UPI00404B0D3D
MKKPAVLCALSLAIGLSVYNFVTFQSKRNLQNTSFENFIINNTGKSPNISSEYNLYFIITPIDCQKCIESVVSLNFINETNRIAYKKDATISINYIISGDYSEEEKMDFISEIRNEVNVYIDKNNQAKDFLYTNFHTLRTPFLIILKQNGQLKYWQDFAPDERIGYQNTDKIFLRLLECIQ